MDKIIKIYAWPERPLGTLWFHYFGEKRSSSFEYDPSWLRDKHSWALEPSLPLYQGTYHTNELPIFGSIADSSPDRWGRTLILKNERNKNQNMPQKTRTLTELDFLLGIDDETRQGSLRFKENEIGQFLQCRTVNAIPALLSLPKLLVATEKIIGDTESDEDLRLLLAGGSSLGGTRPKASVYDNNILSIAKFPKIDDAIHTSLWEALALLLAEKSGIQVPKWKIIKVAKKSVLLLQRFDRNNEERIPFISAMSMLGAKDNERHSYIEIAESIILQGSNVQYNLRELWKRMVFNICISNLDDHLRNHGFLRNSSKGWNLSPAYDMNPVSRITKPNIHAISINENSCEGSIDSAFSVIEAFNIKISNANAIFSNVQQSLKEWKTVAISLGIPKKEIEEMENAFIVNPASFAINRNKCVLH